MKFAALIRWASIVTAVHIDAVLPTCGCEVESTELIHISLRWSWALFEKEIIISLRVWILLKNLIFENAYYYFKQHKRKSEIFQNSSPYLFPRPLICVFEFFLLCWKTLRMKKSLSFKSWKPLLYLDEKRSEIFPVWLNKNAVWFPPLSQERKQDAAMSLRGSSSMSLFSHCCQ